MNLSKIHHIAIIVSDYEAAKDFYVNKLGFSVCYCRGSTPYGSKAKCPVSLLWKTL